MSQRLKQINRFIHKDSRTAHLRSSSKLSKKQLLSTLFPDRISKHFETVYALIRDNPALFQHADIEDFYRKQERKFGMKQALKIMNSLNIDLEADPYKFVSAMYSLSFFGIGQSIKGLVHYLLYIKTILVFKTNQYHEKQLQRAKKLQDLGSFSLTQMNHGSFSRGIGTQAKYDHSTREFIVNTFGQTGMKFWIGNTAQTATKTIMWAQLIVNGNNYGPHPFIMQLRDYKTHETLKGIITGDCGYKNGLNSIDNGYIILKDVRIPVDALLGKLGYVDQNGKYISKIQTNEQRFGLHMSPLSSGRAILSLTVLSQSASALIIAFRYVCERRQFKVNENQQQLLLIDYPMTRYRLLVPLATNIVYYFAASNINKLYIENAQNFTDPTKKIVSQLHAASAVLKAKVSWFTNEAITQCREMLGGHGYSSYSTLGRRYNENDINSTWEGDNNLLLQQTSKYLLKILKLKQKTSIISLQFVQQGLQSLQPTQQILNNLSQLRVLLQDIFIHRYNTVVKQMAKTRNEAIKREISSDSIQSYVWNQIQPYFCNQMALAYGDLLYFDALYKVLMSYKGTEANKQFLSNCLKVWSQNILLKNSFSSLQTRKMLQKLIIEGCELLYPDCITATDVLAPPSEVLGSPFAQQDGEGMKAYINLLFSGNKTFRRVPWFQKLIKLKQQA